ncbi:MAG: phosphodiester glycosidase family protein, partial [bacterium]|nr:phosphodiester glycosidase family protein [bacterium]
MKFRTGFLVLLFLVLFHLFLFADNFQGDNFSYYEYNKFYFKQTGPLEIRVIKIHSGSDLEVNINKGTTLQKSSELLTSVNGSGCINANYFDPNSGRILGVYGVNNKIVSEPVPGIPARPVFIIDSSGKPYIKKFSEKNIHQLKSFRIALGGGPTLIRNGKTYKKYSDEKFTNNRNPLSAIGIDEYNNLYFITVDGRKTGKSIGMKYNELAEFLIEYFGIKEAMGFDGGGSTTMVLDNPETEWYDPEIMNSPSDNKERNIASIIYFSEKKSSCSITFEINSVPDSFSTAFIKKFQKDYQKNNVKITRNNLKSILQKSGKKVVVLRSHSTDLSFLNEYPYYTNTDFLIFITANSENFANCNYCFTSESKKYYKVYDCSYKDTFPASGKVLLRWRNVIDVHPAALEEKGNVYFFNGDPLNYEKNIDFVVFI